MKNLLIAFLFIASMADAQVLKVVVAHKPVSSGSTGYLDSAQFRFSTSLTAISGFTNVVGNPHTSVITATGAYGISISTVATANWTAFSSATSSNNGGAVGSSTHFPSGVTTGYFYTQRAPTTTATPQIEVSGLTPGATYEVIIIASRLAAGGSAGKAYQSYILKDAGGDSTYLDYDAYENTSRTAVFGENVADANGKLYLCVNARSPIDANYSFGRISGLKVRRYPR